MVAAGKFICFTLLIANPLAAAVDPGSGLGDPSDYQIDSRVWLGSVIGQVSVDPRTEVEVTRSGEIYWKVEEGEQVEEDQVIALTGYRQIELSKRQLSLDTSRLDQKLNDIVWSTRESVRSLETSIREQQDLLQRMSLTKTEREILGDRFEGRLSAQKKEVEARLAEMQERLESNYFEKQQELDEASAELEIQRLEQEHDDLVRNSQVVAPSDGEVEILQRKPIVNRTVAAEIVKRGLAEVTVALSDPRLRDISGEFLEAEIRGPNGVLYDGRYLKEAERQTMNPQERNVVFEITPAESEEAVPEAMAGSRMVSVYRTLEKEGHIVPKEPLLYEYPEELGQKGWRAFINARWPDAEILFIAPREIVIAVGGEN